MSGVAASFDQATGILKLLCETRWTKEEMQRRFFARWGLLRQIAEAVDELGEEQVRAMHPLFYKKSATFQSLFAACRRTLVDPDFNETNFPLESVAPDEDEWEVCEHHFTETVKGEVAFPELEKLGYRLCGPRRAMEFIVAHPDLQMDRPLVVTARWQDRGDAWSAPVFSRDGGERVLYFRYLDDYFSPHYGWLVMKKRAA